MIIPSPQSVTSTRFDVFLEPLLEELLDLWDVGVETHDATAYGGSQYFNFCAILIWTIHDFLAYGIISGLVMKGYLGCFVCGPGIKSRRSAILAKNVWDCMHWRYLSVGHVWWTEEFADLFNGEVEHGLPPTRITPAQHIRYGKLRESFQYNGFVLANEDQARRYGVNQVSALW